MSEMILLHFVILVQEIPSTCQLNVRTGRQEITGCSIRVKENTKSAPQRGGEAIPEVSGWKSLHETPIGLCVVFFANSPLKKHTLQNDYKSDTSVFHK